MPIDVDSEAQIKTKLKEFLRRDYRQDIERLNESLGNGGDAGFTGKMAPVPFAGNPFALDPGNCIAVLGINPKWKDPQKDAESEHDLNRQKLKSCVDSFCAGDDKQFDEFLAARASDFSGGSYYGPYFTKLGNHLFREWFHGKVSAVKEGQPAAKEVFRRYVLKTDLLPWFSVGTAKIGAKKLASSNDPALMAYYETLDVLFHALKPKWIQFNGSSMRDTIEVIVQTDLLRIETDDGKYIWVGRSKKMLDTPVLVHEFTNRAGGPQTPKQFHSVAQAFRSWIKDDEYFEFH
jgi:hypothetical protein